MIKYEKSSYTVWLQCFRTGDKGGKNGKGRVPQECKRRYRDFLFLGNGFPVLADNGFLCQGVDFLYFLFNRVRRRGKDFDTLLSFHYVALKGVFPSGKAYDMGSVGLLHSDKQRVIEAVIMKLWHHLQVFFETLAVKPVSYTHLDVYKRQKQ